MIILFSNLAIAGKEGRRTPKVRSLVEFLKMSEQYSSIQSHSCLFHFLGFLGGTGKIGSTLTSWKCTHSQNSPDPWLRFYDVSNRVYWQQRCDVFISINALCLQKRTVQWQTSLFIVMGHIAMTYTLVEIHIKVENRNFKDLCIAIRSIRKHRWQQDSSGKCCG